MQTKGPLNIKHLLGLLVLALITYIAVDFGVKAFSNGTATDLKQTQNTNQKKEETNTAPKVKEPSGNSMMVLAPYKEKGSGSWVFDDAKKGLTGEPFVEGIPEMIDILTKDISQAEKGFRLIFSAKPFPNYQQSLTWLREDENGVGNFYKFDGTEMEGWLCPALLKYFDKAPQKIYVKAEEKKQ